MVEYLLQLVLSLSSVTLSPTNQSAGCDLFGMGGVAVTCVQLIIFLYPESIAYPTLPVLASAIHTYQHGDADTRIVSFLHGHYHHPHSVACKGRQKSPPDQLCAPLMPCLYT